MYASQALLLVLAAASGYGQLFPCVPDCQYPLPRNVENISYELHVQPYFPADGVEVDPAKNYTFDGFVRIQFRVNSFAHNVSLDHLNQTLQNVQLYRNQAAVDVATDIDNTTGRLVVLLEEHFVPTYNYTIDITYTGLINADDQGVAYSTYSNAKGGSSVMIHTQFEPRNARRLLPCFDDPHFKAVFELTLTYPKGYTALSNTRPRTTLATSEPFVSTTFHRTPRMSTYLLAFTIGKLVSSAADFTSGKEVRVWGWEEMGGSLEFAANVSGMCVSAMENYTGIPYALDKLDIVAVTGTGFAMENWGLIIAAYSIVYSDPR
ncbi:Protein T16G12.1, partial [Aphelenchoides avenae]